MDVRKLVESVLYERGLKTRRKDFPEPVLFDFMEHDDGSYELRNTDTGEYIIFLDVDEIVDFLEDVYIPPAQTPERFADDMMAKAEKYGGIVELLGTVDEDGDVTSLEYT